MKTFLSTTKGSSRPSLRARRLKLLIYTVLILLVLLLVLPSFLRGAVSVVLYPVVVTQTWLAESPSTIPQYWRDRTVLIDTITTLEQTLAETGELSLVVQQLENENSDLRRILGDEGELRIGAGVVGRPGYLPHDRLLVDAGINDGVVVGAPVYIGEHTVIGYIQAVTAETSLITLLSSPNHESTVYVVGPNIYTTAIGMGGGVLQVGVPQGVPLETGNIVLVPSFAAGMYGEITYIDSVPTRPEQFAFVTSPIPLASIRIVSIGRQALTPDTFEEVRFEVDAVRTDLTTVPVPEGVLIDITDATTTASTTESLATTTASSS